MDLMNKVPWIYYWIFQQAFEVSERCISSADPHSKLWPRVCVDIFITGLFLELRVCAEVHLYLRKSFAAAQLMLVVR